MVWYISFEHTLYDCDDGADEIQLKLRLPNEELTEWMINKCNNWKMLFNSGFWNAYNWGKKGLFQFAYVANVLKK